MTLMQSQGELYSAVPAPWQQTERPINRRVRAIVLTDDGQVLFIKRQKPHAAPYWVAPGGGVEDELDASLLDALHRELCEELGATVEVLETAFVLRHEKAGKNLEEHFFICRLVDFDLALRSGPEFDDPARGAFLPYAVPLDAAAIAALELRTPELGDWLLGNLDLLRALAAPEERAA